MIGALRGRIESKSPGVVLVDVGGVVYEVSVSLQSFARMPDEGAAVRLDVVTHVREDAFVLFGFLDRDEKEMFHWLQTVSGVGPRLALNILSGMPARDLRGALASGDVARLTRLPGIGRKTSERLILELRERCQRAESAALDAPGAAPETVGRDEEAVSALVNLGYKRADAEKVLRDIAPDVRLEDAIREALRRFAR
ncbi:MAG: Holliday junction helicase subunit RuvA [Pseudomonadota bacterium]|jgi:Holliday junction DNA helicase RuvA